MLLDAIQKDDRILRLHLAAHPAGRAIPCEGVERGVCGRRCVGEGKTVRRARRALHHQARALIVGDHAGADACPGCVDRCGKISIGRTGAERDRDGGACAHCEREVALAKHGGGGGA